MPQKIAKTKREKEPVPVTLSQSILTSMARQFHCPKEVCTGNNAKMNEYRRKIGRFRVINLDEQTSKMQVLEMMKN